MRDCNIFVSLFKTKTGQYTEEEFDVAHKVFQETGSPLIYTYFKKAEVSNSSKNRKDLISLWDFQEKLDNADPAVRAIIHMLTHRLRKTNLALLESETRELVEIAFV